MKTKRIMSIALTLAMLAGVLPGMRLTASAADTTTEITPSNPSGTMTITLTIEDSNSTTKVDTEVNTSSEAPTVKVSNLDEKLAVGLLTEEEKEAYDAGTPLKVYLNVDVVGKDQVPTDDLEALDKKIGTDFTYGECLDLTLWKKLGDQAAVQVHDTNGNPVYIAVEVPKSLTTVPEGYTRTYQIIRVHDGVATVLAEGTDTTLNISSDLFSSYFIVYRDVKKEAPTVSPKTGDAAPIAALIVCMLSAAGAFVLMDLKKKKNRI